MLVTAVVVVMVMVVVGMTSANGVLYHSSEQAERVAQNVCVHHERTSYFSIKSKYEVATLKSLRICWRIT
jgi:hypothetical protein